MLIFAKRNSPPPYSNVTFLNEHPLQATPSTLYRPPVKIESAMTMFPNGGTTGTHSLQEKGLCANVDVWFPSNNMQNAPNANDNRDSVTFRISSSLVGECGKWVYHYGTTPDKQSDSRPQPILVGNPQDLRLPQDSKHGRLFPLPLPE